MEAWSLDTYQRPTNPFAQGLCHALTQEEYTIENDTREKESLLPKTNKRNLYTQEQDVSKETKELILQFLTLPTLAQEHIITFLESHSLAYFARLPYISNKSRCKAYKQLKGLHTRFMIQQYESNPTPKTHNNFLLRLLHLDLLKINQPAIIFIQIYKK